MIDFFVKIKDFLTNICTFYLTYIYAGMALSLIILIISIFFLPFGISLILMPFITYIMAKLLITNKTDKNYLYSVLIGCAIILFCGLFIYL